MADLKELLGENYKEEMTSDEIVEAIKQNEKLVNLSTGKYVAKGKFDDLNAKFERVSKTAQDYEKLKGNLDSYKEKYTELTMKENLRKSGVKDEFLDYALFKMKKAEVDVNDPDKFNEHISKWLKENPQYGKTSEAGSDSGEKTQATKTEDEPEDTNPQEPQKKKPRVILGGVEKDADKSLPKKAWNRFNY